MHYKFDCGCSFPVIEESKDSETLPLIDFNIDDINLDCKATWDLIGRGITKGVFQLESNLGKSWSKKLKPESIQHLSALGSILRPGCISKDTTIAIKNTDRQGKNINFKRITIEQLYEKYIRNRKSYKKNIVSLNESNILLFNNKIENVTYSGKQEVFKPQFRIRKRQSERSTYNLECTADHMLFTHDRNWVQLQNIEVGERIAIISKRRTVSAEKTNCKGEKAFREICFYNYKYRCVFCYWNEASLDVNHIDGNRKTNNDFTNLSFLCPNHHKMYSENKISKEQIILARSQYEIKNSKDIIWAEYLGKKSLGIKDTYDIQVEGPNHNFIAGNIVVHNSLRGIDEKTGLTITQLYCSRKNGQEKIEYVHECLEPILRDTFGCSIFQEQNMQIVQLIAGFTLQEADELRKSMGKKDPFEMSKVKVKFFNGVKKVGLVNNEQAVEIFNFIEKAQRYLFNRSHAVSYGLNGYISAFLKAHFPVQFYTSWLYYAKDKQDPKLEVKELVNDAKLLDVEVLPPDIRNMETHFSTDGKVVTFGLSNIKGVGEAQIVKLAEAVKIVSEKLGRPIEKWCWYEILIHLSPLLNNTVITRLISVGAFRYCGISRTRMLDEYAKWDSLTTKEQKWIIDNSQTIFENQQLKMWENFKGPPTSILEAMQCLLGANACFNQKRRDHVESNIKLIEQQKDMGDNPDWIATTEENYLGISISCNKMDSCDTSAVNCTCKDYLAGRDGTLIFGVEINTIREIKVKNGKQIGRTMAFLSVSDGTCAIEMIAFPEAWKEFSHILTPNNTVIIQARRDKKKDCLIIDNSRQA